SGAACSAPPCHSQRSQSIASQASEAVSRPSTGAQTRRTQPTPMAQPVAVPPASTAHSAGRKMYCVRLSRGVSGRASRGPCTGPKGKRRSVSSHTSSTSSRMSSIAVLLRLQALHQMADALAGLAFDKELFRLRLLPVAHQGDELAHLEAERVLHLAVAAFG